MSDENNFEIIKQFHSDDGVLAVITTRMRNGRKNYTYSFRKSYDKDGAVAQTPWLQKQHIGSVRELLTLVEDWIQAAEDVDRAAARRGKQL
jgi:hypothetical protein